MKASTFHDRVSQYPHHHRIALAVLLTVMFCTGNVYGQNTAFTLVSPYSGLTTDQTKVVNFADSQPHIGGLQYIDWAPASLVDNNGYITVALPGEFEGQPISFELLDSYFANETNYAVFGRSPKGEIAIYITPEGTGGSITLANSAYVLYPLGGTKGVFIKKDPSETKGGTCATDTTPGEGSGYCEDDCGADIIDVLTMVTPAAQQWLNDNYGLFGLWFLFVETNNINGALINSNVPNKRVRVQTISYTPDFPLTGSTATDLNNLTASQDAQQTLLQSGADVGILLTNQNYGSVAGRANSLDPTSTNKFCIAQVQFIDPIRYTYAHELAHQIGCRHDNDPFPGCPHGKQMSIGKNTIMALAANNTRIQHFSNPDVFFGGESTGTVATRDNAAQLSGAFCEVANNNSPIWFATDYTHSSASQITPDCPFTATANVQQGMQEIWGNLWNCGTSYTYQWAWSTNNVNYTNFGTNSPTLNLSAAPSCPVFFLRLTVTTPIGCSTTFTKMFTCNPNIACRSSSAQNEEAVWSLEYDRIIPNPANDKVQVNLEGVSYVKRVTAFNTNGSSTIYNLPIVGFDSGVLTCDVSRLHTGLWFIEINSPEKRKVFKLAIAR